MESETVRSWTLSVPLELMVTVESSVPGPAVVAAGIDWSAAVGAKDCVPVIEPSGPMIDTTWAGVKELVWIARSKVTWNSLVEELSSRSSVPVDCWPVVETACVEAIWGPGTIRGTVFWLNGGLRMYPPTLFPPV